MAENESKRFSGSVQKTSTEKRLISIEPLNEIVKGNYETNRRAFAGRRRHNMALFFFFLEIRAEYLGTDGPPPLRPPLPSQFVSAAD